MQFDVVVEMRLFTEFRLGADDVNLAALVAHPNRQRSAPVSFTRNAPIYDVFKEIAHTTVFDGLGHPVDRIV